MSIVLRPYQQQCIEKIVSEARNGKLRQVIVLSTGLGKTVIFGHLPSLVKAKGKKTLILAHREELLDQAKDKLLLIDPSLKVEIEQGERQVVGDVDVVVASVATIGRQNSERIKKFNPKDFGLLIIDETHHVCSDTYRRVLEYFDVLKGKIREPNSRVLLGVTATPNRGDHQGLDTVFDDITYSYTLKDGIENGYLSNIKAFSVKTASDLSGVHIKAGDFIETELAAAVNNDERNQLIVESYKEIAPNSQALVFATNVEHTEELTSWFQKAGINAEYVIGATKKEKRKQILQDFQNKKIQVLLNCAVLTEGFDCPNIETILMARPTKSSVLFAQMVGRGTRLAEGKDALNLIDFVDNTGKNSIITLPSLFGVPGTLKGTKGKFITQILEQVEKIQEVNPDYDLSKIEDWSEEGIEKVIKIIDIFAQAELPPIVKEKSRFSWERYKEGFQLQFPINENDLYKEGIKIEPNMLNQYEIKKMSWVKTKPSYLNNFKKWEKTSEEILSSHSDIGGAFQLADNWVSENKPEFKTMFSQNSKWRQDAPTEKQLALLKKFRIPTPEGLSKGQASVLLSKAFSNKKSRTNF